MKTLSRIDQAIATYLEKLGLKVDIIEWEHPQDQSHGDYSTNIALKTFSQLNKDQQKVYKNPRDLAQNIVDQIHKQAGAEHSRSNQDDTNIDKIEVAGPGFINVHLSQTYLVDLALTVLKDKDTFGSNSSLKGKKVCVEYTDPNPFKEFHIGHLYSNTVGESLSRILEFSGAKVWRADYFGDVGMHAAKSIWGIIKKLDDDSLKLNDLSKWPLEKRIEYFGQGYALGANAYLNDKSAQDEIKELNFLIFKIAQDNILPDFNTQPYIDYDQFLKSTKFDYEDIKKLYITGRQWSLDYFETIYQRVGTNFDGYYPESVVGEIGYELVMKHLKNGDFVKGEKGAIVFPGEKHGLHTRVFINALGLPTYEAKELGLAPKKYQDFNYDQSLVVTGNEINEYFNVLIAALKMVNPKLGSITTHIGHGMVRLPEGKMSSRTGNIIRGDWVLDESKQKILNIIQKDKKNDSRKSNEDEETAEVVAVGAVKYALLKHSIGGNIAFDFGSSLSFDGNSGPYLQYTYARCKSVIRKSQAQNPKSKTNLINSNIINSNFVSNFDISAVDLSSEESSLLRLFPHFSEVILKSSSENAPHHICTYLFELAQSYNTFYNSHSILGSKKQSVTNDQKNIRLMLTAATAQIIKNGLHLLGIKAPEKM